MTVTNSQPSSGDDMAHRTSPWPTVTAVIPTKNRPELLARAVQAVMNQDYPGQVECIVVFDGSEPVTPEVTVPANRTLTVLVNNRTPGLAGNRNTGYLAATGEYVASCDDDDEWLPDKLSAQVELLRRRPDASAAASGYLLVNAERDIERTAPLPVLTFEDLLRHRHTEANASTYMLRRSALVDDIGLVDEQLPGSYAEDYDLLLRAARTGPIVCIQRPLTRVYVHKSSFFADKWRTIDAALTYLLAKVPEFADDNTGLGRIEGQQAFAKAALGQRREAVRLARRSLRRSMKSKQSWAALIVASGLVSPGWVLAAAQRAGYGI
jgi:glycosyltransferase involved in cell wall biosynthesis